jgi:hypothetical protein
MYDVLPESGVDHAAGILNFRIQTVVAGKIQPVQCAGRG